MASFGEEIKRERELRGISLREISDATKINIRFLEALENNDFEHLPGGQFNKGFIRAYANYIGIDPEKIVNSYLLELSKQEESKKPFIPHTPPVEKRKSKGWKLPLSIAAIVAIIVIIIIIFLVSRSAEEEQGKVQKGMVEMTEKPDQESIEGKEEIKSGEKLEEVSAGDIEEKETPPQRSEEMPVTLRQPPHEAQQISLTVEVRKRAKIRAQCNGDELLNRTLSRGDKRTLMCDKELTLSISNRDAIQVFYKGQELHFPEELGKTINNFTITEDNLEALIHGSQK